jgi:predicted glycosyltransferase
MSRLLICYSSVVYGDGATMQLPASTCFMSMLHAYRGALLIDRDGVEPDRRYHQRHLV